MDFLNKLKGWLATAAKLIPFDAAPSLPSFSGLKDKIVALIPSKAAVTDAAKADVAAVKGMSGLQQAVFVVVMLIAFVGGFIGGHHRGTIAVKQAEQAQAVAEAKLRSAVETISSQSDQLLVAAKAYKQVNDELAALKAKHPAPTPAAGPEAKPEPKKAKPTSAPAKGEQKPKKA